MSQPIFSINQYVWTGNGKDNEWTNSENWLLNGSSTTSYPGYISDPSSPCTDGDDASGSTLLAEAQFPSNLSSLSITITKPVCFFLLTVNKNSNLELNPAAYFSVGGLGGIGWSQPSVPASQIWSDITFNVDNVNSVVISSPSLILNGNLTFNIKYVGEGGNPDTGIYLNPYTANSTGNMGIISQNQYSPTITVNVPPENPYLSNYVFDITGTLCPIKIYIPSSLSSYYSYDTPFYKNQSNTMPTIEPTVIFTSGNWNN